MLILREKYVKQILIVFILMQVIGFNAVHGLNCVQCGESGAEECKDDLSNAAKACTNDATKCFTQIDTNGKITRGCLASTETCTADKNCVSTEDSKNNQLVCKTCSGTDSNCSQTDATANIQSKICNAGITKCIKKVNDDKRVVRECASSDDVCANNTNCETCGSVNCNTGIFPLNRLNCYQCNNCSDVPTATIISKPCLLFQDNDECYQEGKSDTTMTRGCKSDTSAANKCSAVAEGCAFCSESGCNKLKYKGPPMLKCHQCTGNSSIAECYQSQTNATLKLCTQEIVYNQAEYCYTQIEGGKIQRGCLNDNTDLTEDKCNDPEGGICSKCTGDGCNGKDVQFTCIRCRSDENPDCKNDATKIKGETCRTASSPADGCFHGIWYDVTIRGCTLDASPRDQALCKEKDNPNKCTICNSKDCNIERSTGAKNGLSLALMSVVFLRVILWNFK